MEPGVSAWFTGDGMVHAFTLSEGRASYRNAWVRTAKWEAERRAGRPLVSGYTSRPGPEGGFADQGVANTNIIWHAGHLLALEEGHLPIELDPATLATRGVQDFAGRLSGPFTAHPKVDPITGELVFFGFSVDGELTPGMRYGTIDAGGRVTRFEHFAAPYCSMVHDFAVTRRRVVFPVLPLSGSQARQRRGGPPFAWEPDLGSQIGLIRREQGTSSLRWFRGGTVLRVPRAERLGRRRPHHRGRDAVRRAAALPPPGRKHHPPSARGAPGGAVRRTGAT